jgi:hypothetical protein
MARGHARTKEEILQAVIRGNGDKSVIAKELNTTVGQVNNYLFRYPEINDVHKAQQRDLGTLKEDAEAAVDENTELIVLTETQTRILERIDKALAYKLDDWTFVDDEPTTVLFKMEEWGLIKLNREGNTWYARMTEDGEIALVKGEIAIKTSEPQALKQKAKAATPETPKKKGGWKNPPKQAPAVNGNGAEHEISDLIGQEEAPNPFEQFREAWLEPDPLPHAEDLPVSELDCGDCDGCLHREAMALIMQKVPAAKEIYEHLAAKKTAENKIDAALKKLGG